MDPRAVAMRRSASLFLLVTLWRMDVAIHWVDGERRHATIALHV